MKLRVDFLLFNKNVYTINVDIDIKIDVKLKLTKPFNAEEITDKTTNKIIEHDM